MALGNWFKVLGSLFSIVLIAYVTAQDSDNSSKHKGLDTTIVITQALMMLLLFTSETFPQGKIGPLSYLQWTWGLLFIISTICLLFRFDLEKDDKWFLAFLGGNLILLVVSNVAFRPEGKTKDTKTEDVKTIDQETIDTIIEGLEKKVNDLEKRVRAGKTQYGDRLAEAKNELAEAERKYLPASPSASKSPQNSPPKSASKSPIVSYL
jgi:hypothetical protein